MAKVRVPKSERPPTRFGIITTTMGTFPDPEAIGKRFRVKCYRPPKEGDFFWYGDMDGQNWGVGHAAFDFENPCVILEEVKD